MSFLKMAQAPQNSELAAHASFQCERKCRQQDATRPLMALIGASIWSQTQLDSQTACRLALN
jgi:hypothetical protein